MNLITEHIQPMLVRKFPVALVAALLFVAVPAFANDDLQPENSVFDGGYVDTQYQGILVSAFKDLYDRDVAVRMIALPSFQHELGVGLIKKGDEYHIVTLEPAHQLWKYVVLDMERSGRIRELKSGTMGSGVWGRPEKDIAALKANLPPDYHDVRMDHCETSVDSVLGVSIVDVWRKMLTRTHYVKPDVISTDGVDYHFSMRDEWLNMAGQANDPMQGSKQQLLVNIAYAMAAYCSEKSSKKLGDLEQAVGALETNLQSDGQK